MTACIIGEQQRVVAHYKAHQHRAVVIVIGADVVYRLVQPQSVLVVFVRRRAGSRELLPAPGQRLSEITRRVSHRVVEDRLIVVRRQLIAPRTVGIGIGGCSRIGCRCVRIDVLFGNVAPVIVGVGYRLIRESVVLPDQFVRCVVRVRYADIALRNLGNVSVRIVLIGVRRITSVLVRRKQCGLRIIDAGFVGKRCIVIAVQSQPTLRDPSDRVVGVRHYLTISERRRQGSVVVVVWPDSGRVSGASGTCFLQLQDTKRRRFFCFFSGLEPSL